MSLLSYGAGENSSFTSEPQAKRARPGSRPRHTDGGATSSLLASAQHQQPSPLPLNQNGAVSPTMPLLSPNLNLSMLASAAVPSFNTTSHHHQQQQQYSYSAMTTPNHATQGNESSSIGAWYQPAPTPFYPMAVDAHFAANVLMGAAQGSLGMSMGSVRAVSSPERFTEYDEAAAGATQSSLGQPYLRSQQRSPYSAFPSSNIHYKSPPLVKIRPAGAHRQHPSAPIASDQETSRSATAAPVCWPLELWLGRVPALLRVEDMPAPELEAAAVGEEAEEGTARLHGKIVDCRRRGTEKKI
ncbi:hypothetical protein OC842_006302 [Tilletia horrida]|uniref:Velvet domain-containing protein n=1 Tax=Tilletia horrida TaxID=155126 RepID=A0AAN6G8G9_9BASI|nr:hypothetical protein OC842_006302 [Tilletia horrida]